MSQYDEHGKLTRAGAVQVIQAGGSVLMGGKVYTNVENLPGEVEFAKGDNDALAQARQRLQSQIATAQAELNSIPVSATTTVPDTQSPQSAGTQVSATAGTHVSSPKARTHAATPR